MNVSKENPIRLRLEEPADHALVERITYEAFKEVPEAEGDEALLAHLLRGCESFVPELDFVAEVDGRLIGNIMYTRSRVVGEGGVEWPTLTFGPVSVLPAFQGKGVGALLIRHTLDIARSSGFRAVLIFGHETYYPRFGFESAEKYNITTADGKNFPAFMALPLYEGALDGVRGHLRFDPVYENLDKSAAEVFNAALNAPDGKKGVERTA